MKLKKKTMHPLINLSISEELIKHKLVILKFQNNYNPEYFSSCCFYGAKFSFFWVSKLSFSNTADVGLEKQVYLMIESTTKTSHSHTILQPLDYFKAY